MSSMWEVILRWRNTIADKLGVELKIVPLEFAAVLSSVTEGKYDLAISALAYTPRAGRSYEFIQWLLF